MRFMVDCHESLRDAGLVSKSRNDGFFTFPSKNCQTFYLAFHRNYRAL